LCHAPLFGACRNNGRSALQKGGMNAPNRKLPNVEPQSFEVNSALCGMFTFRIRASAINNLRFGPSAPQCIARILRFLWPLIAS